MELSAAEKRHAGLAIENTYKEVTREGGIQDLEEALEAARVGVSRHIFRLAQKLTEESPILDIAIEKFSDACTFAEASLKEKHAVDNLKNALPIWSVYKSNILRGMRAGLDPTKFDSEGAFRSATVKALAPKEEEEEEKEDTRVAAASSTKATRPTIDEAEELLDQSTIIPSLRMLLARLVVEAEYVRRGREKEAEEILREAVGALSELVDKRRIRDEATKAAIIQPSIAMH